MLPVLNRMYRGCSSIDEMKPAIPRNEAFPLTWKFLTVKPSLSSSSSSETANLKPVVSESWILSIRSRISRSEMSFLRLCRTAGSGCMAGPSFLCKLLIIAGISSPGTIPNDSNLSSILFPAGIITRKVIRSPKTEANSLTALRFDCLSSFLTSTLHLPVQQFGRKYKPLHLI